jgi:hypothetical protein
MDVKSHVFNLDQSHYRETSVNYEYRTRNENYSVESIERCDNILIYS